ncbi:MAG: ATP-dependent Clp protease adaptor ClpS [Solirubrobacterales bacterium]|nr:ATP-dependent Clp protease adaptor ClpS [Solirubrobacterales bacterium]
MPALIEELPVVGGTGGGLGGHWNVVVLNDSHNTFDHVAETLAGIIPGMTLADGYRTADAIHNRGLAIVWTGPRQDAESYWEQLDHAGLTMAPLEEA